MTNAVVQFAAEMMVMALKIAKQIADENQRIIEYDVKDISFLRLILIRRG